MGKPQQSFSKNEKEKIKAKKREEKQKKKLERKENPKSSSFEDMLVYVDEFGNITDTKPDPANKIEIDIESIEIGVPKKEDREVVDTNPVKNGKVSFFDHSKGFGFIIENLSQEKYFVHVSGLIDVIQENDNVSFELERGMKGMNAVGVKKL